MQKGMLTFKQKIYDISLRYFPLLLHLKKIYDFELKLKSKLQEQLRDEYPSLQAPLDIKSKKVLVPLVETNHYQYLQILILAKALQMRGADVKVLVCDSLLAGCEHKSAKTLMYKDICLECRFNCSHILPLFGLQVIKLSEFISENDRDRLAKIVAGIVKSFPNHYEYKGIDIIPMTNDSVTRYFYGASPSDSNSLSSVRKDHLFTAMLNVDIASKIDAEWSPHIVVNNMPVYTGWEPYYKVFKKNSRTELFTVNISQFDYNSVVINRMALFESADRYNKYLKYRKQQLLTAEEKKILKDFLNNRFLGNSAIFNDLSFFSPDASISNVLNFDRSKRNLFLFPNIYWDVGVSDSGQLFNDVIEWVLQTIELVKNNNTVHLYIKPHPGEKYDSSSSLKGVVDYIFERFPQLPNNVTIIYPEFKLKTYDLFQYIDLGIIYSGTLGLEMLLKGVAVVATGKTPFGGLGLAEEPRSIEEYRDILLNQSDLKKAQQDKVELFAYFYFVRTLVPWTLTKTAYANNFDGYTFTSLSDLLPGKDRYLDHLCDCILDSENTVVEAW